MIFLLLVVLLSAIGQSTQSPVTSTSTPCTNFNPFFYIDKIVIGSYTSARYQNGALSNIKTDLYYRLPSAIYETLMDKLQHAEIYDEIKCDNDTLATYPDLVFWIKDVPITVTPRDYLNFKYASRGICEHWLDDYVFLNVDFTLPTWQYKEQICRAEHPATQTSIRQPIISH